MPIHDWSRVDAGIFHDFHQAWIIAIRNALNGRLLPKGYSALADQRTAGVIPDVVTLQHPSPGRPSGDRTGGMVVTASPPKTRYTRQAENELIYAARANRIAIHHPFGQIISVIEIVSPGNKGSRSAIRSFVEKTIELLNRGIHVLVVDLFPPSARDPQGLPKLIWDEIKEEPFELLSDKPLTLSTYIGGALFQAFIELVAVADKLPDMPVYLDPESYVPLPLEAAYESTWATCPEIMREAVEQGAVSGNG